MQKKKEIAFFSSFIYLCSFLAQNSNLNANMCDSAYPNLDCNKILALNLKTGFLSSFYFFLSFFCMNFDTIYKKEDKKILILDKVQKRKIDSKK